MADRSGGRLLSVKKLFVVSKGFNTVEGKRRTFHSLGHSIGNQGQTAEAVALLTATLATQQRVLGSGHPQTQRTVQQLQHWQQHEVFFVSSIQNV